MIDSQFRRYFTYGGSKIPEPTDAELKKLDKEVYSDEEWAIYYADMFLDWAIDERMDG